MMKHIHEANNIGKVDRAQAAEAVEAAVINREGNAAAILRVFNYYRAFLSFVLLLLFVQVPGQQFVGKFSPELFQTAILIYVGINIFVSVISLALRNAIVARREYVSAVLLADVILLCVLMYASGGVSSGIGTFLIFPVAFAGVLAFGRYSVAIAAIAIILGFYSESNVIMRSGDLESALFFKMGVLGIALFAVNMLFQYLAVQLRRKEAEVTTLQRLNEVRELAAQTKSQLDDSNAKFEVLLNSAGDGVLGLDIKGSIIFANPKAGELLCAPSESLVGRNVRDFAFPGDGRGHETTQFLRSGLLHLLDVAARTTTQPNEWSRANGQRFVAEFSCEATIDADHEPSGAVVIFQDATRRREMEEEMNRLANYDSLTDLANRGYFQASLEQAVARYRRGGTSTAVLLLDLDHFKYINDHFGHDYGDDLLREAAARMLACIRNSDVVARLGGDEFAIILSDFKSKENVALVARNLVEEISRPYEIRGKQLRVSTSVGIAVLEDDLTSPNMLLKAADIALYTSKSEGRDTHRFFSPEMQLEAESLQRIQVALQNAVEQNEFKIVYQPIVSLDDNAIHHSEALIRWNPRGEDPISPDIFIPIAEETGKIGEIGHWVVTHVFEQLGSWKSHYAGCPKVAINVSTKQLSTSVFREQIEAAFERYSVPPSAIELELTETGVMNDPDMVLAELTALRELGVRITLDDFGTGNSSLEYLRKLPIDQLKIDKCFVQGIGDGQHDEEIIRVIVAIADALDLTVVAEGIETAEQLDFLREAGCHFGQGYLFFKPIDAFGLGRIIDNEDRPVVRPTATVTPFPGNRKGVERKIAGESGNRLNRF